MNIMMASDYRTYLAANILSEDKVVTYRLLSRAMKVHVNKAKQMLYEFHRQQNGKKPGSVHATYFIAGKRQKLEEGLEKDAEYEHMQSSPPFRSSPVPQQEELTEEVPVTTMGLVKEEELENLRKEFDAIESIYVYSLAPHSLKDMQLLSDVSREVMQIDSSRDHAESPELYASIINTKVRRRAARTTHPAAAPSTIARKPTPPKPISSVVERRDQKHSSQTSLNKAESQPAQAAPAKDFFNKADKNNQTNPPMLKRNSSSIFKAFAKSKPKLGKEDSGSTAMSGVDSAAQSTQEDETMADASDDEEDTYEVKATTAFANSGRPSKQERQAALKAMMDDDNDDASSAVPTPKEEVEEEPGVLEEAMTGDPVEAVEDSHGRRRGKKRVTKKKTMKDEEGYLVTVDEVVWESYSEDEPEPVKMKAPGSLHPSSSGKQTLKKAKGNGSIMQFFAKK